MAIACSNSYGYTGTYYGVKSRKNGIPRLVIFTTDSYELTEANFALQAQQIAAVKQLKAFPVPINGLTTNHEAETIVTHPDKSRELTMQEKRRYNVTLPANSCLGKQLINFRGFEGGVVFVYDNNIVEGYKLETDKIKGIPLDYVNVKGLDVQLSDGSTIPMVSIDFDLQDESDMTVDGFEAVLDKSWRKIDGLTPVTLIQVGTASATSIVLDVYSTCSTGCNKPIPSLVTADFAVTGAGAITSVAESATVAGRYTLTGTGFTDSSVIDLVAPSALSLIYFPVVSSGAVTINVTP
jgi:hypothetical protein